MWSNTHEAKVRLILRNVRWGIRGLDDEVFSSHRVQGARNEAYRVNKYVRVMVHMYMHFHIHSRLNIDNENGSCRSLLGSTASVSSFGTENFSYLRIYCNSYLKNTLISTHSKFQAHLEYSSPCLLINMNNW